MMNFDDSFDDTYCNMSVKESSGALSDMSTGDSHATFCNTSAKKMCSVIGTC